MKILIVMLLVCGVFLLGMDEPVKTADQDPTQQFPSPFQEEKEDIASTIEEEADTLGEKIDEFSSQLERIFEVLMEKFNELMPKLKEAGARLQEKFQEFLKGMEEEEEPSGLEPQ